MIERAFMFAVFLINPLISIFGMLLYLNVEIFCRLKNMNVSIGLIKFFSFLCVFFISYVNAFKINEGDLVFYTDMFLTAGRLPLIPYLALDISEFIYGLMVWSINRVTFGSIFAFKFFLSFCFYSIMNITTFRFSKAIGANKILLLIGIIFVNFNPILYTSSLHLVRQYLAGAIIIYAIVQKIYYDKNIAFYGVFGLLIHNSSAIILVIVYLSSFFQKKKISTIIYLVITIITLSNYQYVSSLIYKIPVVANSFLGILFLRASQDTTWDLGELPIFSLFFLIVILGISITYSFLRVPANKKANQTKNRRFLSIIYILIIFILMNLHQSELSIRLTFYIYYFVHLVLILVLNKEKYLQPLFLLFNFLLLIFWVFYLDAGRWTYDLPQPIWLTCLYISV